MPSVDHKIALDTLEEIVTNDGCDAKNRLIAISGLMMEGDERQKLKAVMICREIARTGTDDEARLTACKILLDQP